MPGQLGNEFFKHRKSKTKPLDGSVPGVPYNRFRSHLTPPLGSGNERPAAYHHDLYMNGSPREYRPNINAPSVDWSDYEIYEPIEKSHVSKDFSLGFNANRSASTLGIIPENEQNAGADIHVLNTVAEEIARRFLDLADALNSLQQTLPKEHPDVMNVRNALSEIINDPESMSKLETLAGNDTPSKLGSGNPYEINMFEQIPDGMELPEILVIKDFEPEMFSDESVQQTLDDIVANETMQMPAPDFTDNMMAAMQQPYEMIADEINQAIDQVIEQSMPQEPEPFMQPDPFMAPQYMFDPQYMPNYMMPGQMPFGPMGPM